MNIYIGIDPSLAKTAVCVLLGERPVVTINGRDAHGGSVRSRIDELGVMLSYLAFDIENAGVDPKRLWAIPVCIEGYSHASKFHAHQLGEYGGVLRKWLLERHEKVYEVAPLTLKKWATGKGKGDKTPMIAAITKRYGVEFETDDEYDAYALARLCQQLVGHATPANEAQREAIETVINGSEKKAKVKKARKAKA